MWKYIGIALIVTIGAYIGIGLSQWKEIMDSPGKDIDRKHSVPTLQGVIFFILFILSVSLFFPEFWQTGEFLGLVTGGGLIMIYSIIDDLHNVQRFENIEKGLPPWIRLILQVSIALIAYFVGGIGIEEFVWMDGQILYFPVWLTLLINIIWFGGFINAINWFDGINGQASGVSAIGFLTIALLIKLVVFQIFQVQVPGLLNMGFSLSLVLFILSFIYSIIEYKPIGLLRDAGVMFMGFGLGYLALLGGAKIGTILVALSLVIFDSVWVFINRLLEGSNPLKSDFSHLHYRLMAIGWKKVEVKWFVWVWSIFCMVLMILQKGNRLNKVIIFGMMALIFFGVNIYLFWIKGLPSHYEPDVE